MTELWAVWYFVALAVMAAAVMTAEALLIVLSDREDP